MKILLLDIETSPSKAYIWGLWQEVTSCTMIDKDWFILCYAAKWLNNKAIYSASLPDYTIGYKKNSENDKELLLSLWKLLDEADIVIAHNGINFDRKKINARFIINGITPPSPYRMIDTLEVARREFAFTSNKLADLCKFLGIGEKIDTGGFQLWKDCLAGLRPAWKKMVQYCRHDIILLESAYLALRPFIYNHPNVAVNDADTSPCCGRCSSLKLTFRGYAYSNTGQYHRFVCNDCGGWGRRRLSSLPVEKRKSLYANI